MAPMVVVAHQGGWDEALFVLVPVAIFGLLLWLANRRAARRLAAYDAAQATAGGEAGETATGEARAPDGGAAVDVAGPGTRPDADGAG